MGLKSPDQFRDWKRSLTEEFHYLIPRHIYLKLEQHGIFAGTYLYRVFVQTINKLHNSTFQFPTKQYFPAARNIESFKELLIHNLRLHKEQSKTQPTVFTFKKYLQRQFVNIFPASIYDELFAKTTVKPMSWLSNIFCDFIHSTERPNEDSKTDKQDPNYSVEDQTYAESSNNFRSQNHHQSNYQYSNNSHHSFGNQTSYFIPYHIGQQQLYQQMLQSFNFWVSRSFNVPFQYLHHFHMQMTYPNQFNGYY